MTVRPPDHEIDLREPPSVRRLVADQLYFGLEARALRAGAARLLARVEAQDRSEPQVDVHRLGADFRLDAAASSTLLSTLLARGMLHPDGTGSYRPTGRFREFALARVVAPLSRGRAKALIDTARELAARINADWVANPFQIETIAVSGSYMSLRDPLPELALWVVLRPRPESRGRRRKPPLEKVFAKRQILTAVCTLSSFIVVRIVADTQTLPRPFSVVFEPSDDMRDRSPSVREMLSDWRAWLRDWSASITRRPASR